MVRLRRAEWPDKKYVLAKGKNTSLGITGKKVACFPKRPLAIMRVRYFLRETGKMSGQSTAGICANHRTGRAGDQSDLSEGSDWLVHVAKHETDF